MLNMNMILEDRVSWIHKSWRVTCDIVYISSQRRFKANRNLYIKPKTIKIISMCISSPKTERNVRGCWFKTHVDIRLLLSRPIRDSFCLTHSNTLTITFTPAPVSTRVQNDHQPPCSSVSSSFTPQESHMSSLSSLTNSIPAASSFLTLIREFIDDGQWEELRCVNGHHQWPGLVEWTEVFS